VLTARVEWISAQGMSENFSSARLRELRLARGLTQIALSERAGLHRNSVCIAEKGQDIALSTVRKLADALECNLADLFEEVDEGAA